MTKPRKWRNDAVYADAMEHIATYALIESVQMEIVATAMRTNQVAVAFVLDTVRPTTAGRALVFAEALRRVLPPEDARLLEQAWNKAIGPVGRVRQRFAHWIWAEVETWGPKGVEPRFMGRWLVPPHVFLEEAALERDLDNPAVVTIPTGLGLTLGTPISDGLFHGLADEARSALGVARLILRSLEDALRVGGLPPARRLALTARRDRPRLRHHKRLLEPPPPQRAAAVRARLSDGAKAPAAKSS